MGDCCQAKKNPPLRLQTMTVICPQCGGYGWNVDIITLKSLLRPEVLDRLLPQSSYAFCPNSDCPIVYFASQSIFAVADLKVSVFQKDSGMDVPVCYCFGWTRKRIADEIAETGTSTAITQVTEHTKVGRCGCDVNNPQGSCCLGNLRSVVKQFATP